MSQEVLKASPGSRSSAAARWYAAGCGLFLLALCSTTLVVTTTRWFPLHNHDPGLRNIGYSHRVRNINCEILLYGDSTALTGLDPAIFEKLTGLRTCNISEGSTIQNVVGSDAPLQAYLAHNRPPRFLLTMWGPMDFRPDRPAGSDLFPEGMTYAMQFQNNWPTWKMLLSHGYWLPHFAATALYGMVRDFIDRRSGHAKTFDAVSYRDSRQGWYPYPTPPETECERNKEPFTEDEFHRWAESVATFRRKYTTPQTQVIVDISAMPSCEKWVPLYERLAQGLPDNKLERWPINYFNEGDVHFTPQAADLLSAHAAQQILARMNESPAQQVGATAR